MDRIDRILGLIDDGLLDHPTQRSDEWGTGAVLSEGWAYGGVDYDPGTDCWTRTTIQIGASGEARLVSVGPHIYALGGNA